MMIKYRIVCLTVVYTNAVVRARIKQLRINQLFQILRRPCELLIRLILLLQLLLLQEVKLLIELLLLDICIDLLIENDVAVVVLRLQLILDFLLVE